VLGVLPVYGAEGYEERSREHVHRMYVCTTHYVVLYEAQATCTGACYTYGLGVVVGAT